MFRPGYECDNVIGVNDCVYYVALLNGVLVITTKQGVYLFKMTECYVCSIKQVKGLKTTTSQEYNQLFLQ